MTNYDNVKKGLDFLRGKDNISDSTIDFFSDIIRAQHTTSESLQKLDISCSISKKQGMERMHKGLPLISLENMFLDDGLVKELFVAICEIIKKHGDSEIGQTEKLISAESEGILDLSTMIEKLFKHDNNYFQLLAEENSASEDLLVFIALSVAKPFFEAAAEKIRDLIAEDEWLKHYCPVCGSPAQIATLDGQDGKRFLHCMLCGTKWRFMRLQCSFCGNNQASGLKFMAEEGSSYRIDLCDNCGRYIKTLDERKFSEAGKEIIPVVEDIATMYLDMVAEKKGYKKSWFFPPSAENEEPVPEEKHIFH